MGGSTVTAAFTTSASLRSISLQILAPGRPLSSAEPTAKPPSLARRSIGTVQTPANAAKTELDVGPQVAVLE